MGKGGPKESLWNASLNWMKKNHGKNFDKDKKGTLNVLLEHLDGFLGEVSSVIEDDFVPLDLEVIEEAGIVPLIVPEKLSYLFGSSYILQSEVNEGLKFKVEPSIDETEHFESFDEADIECNIKCDPSYELEEEDDGDLIDDPSYEGEEEEEDGELEEEDDVEIINEPSFEGEEEGDVEIVDELQKEKDGELRRDPSYEPDEEEEDDGVYTCAKCSSTHETYDDLVDHLQKPCVAKKKSPKKKKAIFKGTIEDRTCQICSKTFASYRYLKFKHSSLCKGPERNPLNFTLLKCSNCQKEYKTIRHYYFHLKRCSQKDEDQITDQVNSSNLGEFLCLKCGFIANSKEELKTSEHKCEPKKHFICSKCDYRTFNFSLLRSHDLAIHHKNDPAFCCEICGANFSYKAGFDRHLKTHAKKPPKIPCPICNQLLSRKATLAHHLKIRHNPSEQHPCESCGKIYTTAIYLDRHIKTQHTEIGLATKHECTYCHSSFRDKRYLKKHIRRKHSNNT